MNSHLAFYSLLFILFILLYILYHVKRGKIKVRYSVIWLFIFWILFIFLIIPGFLNFITKLFGFSIASNMIFSLLIAVLVIINIYLTTVLSSQDKKINLLIQEVSLLKGDKKYHD